MQKHEVLNEYSKPFFKHRQIFLTVELLRKGEVGRRKGRCLSVEGLRLHRFITPQGKRFFRYSIRFSAYSFQWDHIQDYSFRCSPAKLKQIPWANYRFKKERTAELCFLVGHNENPYLFSPEMNLISKYATVIWMSLCSIVS